MRARVLPEEGQCPHAWTCEKERTTLLGVRLAEMQSAGKPAVTPTAMGV